MRLDAFWEAIQEDELTLREMLAVLDGEPDVPNADRAARCLRRLMDRSLVDVRWRVWPDSHEDGVAWDDVLRGLAESGDLPLRHVVVSLTDRGDRLAAEHQQRLWRRGRS
jgi:hypothetical protein